MADFKVGSKQEGREVTLSWNPPANLDAALEAWGEEKVFDLVLRQAATDVKNLVRPHFKVEEGKEPKTDEELQALVNDYTPGARRTGAGTRSKAVDKMTIEQLEALLASKKAEAASA